MLALLLFGGTAIHSFTATMMFGVVLVGTYTSVFIAAPILIYLGVGTGRTEHEIIPEPKPEAKVKPAPRRPEGAGAGRELGWPRRTRRAESALSGRRSYGKGGFRFEGMSHRGSLLCLPSGLWAWPVTQAADIDEAALAPVFAEAADIDLFLLGAGRDRWIMPDGLHDRFRGPQDQCRGDAHRIGRQHLQHPARRRPPRRAGLIAVD